MKTRDLSDVDTVEDNKNKKKLPITLHLDKGRSQIRCRAKIPLLKLSNYRLFLLLRLSCF